LIRDGISGQSAFRCWKAKTEATDREIDNLVYELYGLSDEEIRIVEEVTAR
jgi:hypothetical protein